MLHRAWVAPLVFGFWCVTTGWLVVTKILPTFEAGVAPDQSAILATAGRLPPVGWTVLWDGSPIGWSLTNAERAADGGITIENRLHCDRLPLDEVLPAWAGALVRRAAPNGQESSLDAHGRVHLDADGRLRSFTSTVTLPGTTEEVTLEGRADAAGQVTVTFRAGEFNYETVRQVPERALVGDELSPQGTLPGLFEGRRWTVPVYNPLRPGPAPLQFLHAEVGGEETIFWGNRLVIARVVTYREDPSSPREPRSRLWVDRSGRVLRQESVLLGTKMEFVRRTDAEARRLALTAAALDSGRADPGPRDAPDSEESP